MDAKLSPEEAWIDFYHKVILPEHWALVSRPLRSQIAKAQKRYLQGRLTPEGIESIISRTFPDWYKVEKTFHLCQT